MKSSESKIIRQEESKSTKACYCQMPPVAKHSDNLSGALTFTLVLVFVLCALLSSCTGEKTTLNRYEESNYAVENALLSALEEENRIQKEIEGMLSRASSGTIGLETLFDSLSGQSEKILSLIDSIYGAGGETDKNLSEAKEQVNEYLRERIHQIENCLSAASIADLQGEYLKNEALLESLKKKAVDKLVDYNPDLKKELQKLD